ncbi:MAG: cytochrome c-type biogenesis protein CcmH [Deltaproteobacteria bacterium]|nr:cytochrome c-type biogenesis protein CcmH [Deltaproteobacteria bacterium]
MYSADMMFSGFRFKAIRSGARAGTGVTARSAALLVAVLLLAGLLNAGPALAQMLSGEALDAEVRRISDGLRCPTCQGISVNDSDASFSNQIKDKVRRMLMEGQNEEQIRAYFVSRYGEWILRAPKKEGLGLVLWVLPGLLMLVIGFWVGYKVYTNTRENIEEQQQELSQPQDDKSGLTTEQLQRIEKDLKRYEELD